MIELPNKKKCYNLPEQVAQNLLNIQYLAEQYKNIDALPAIWQTYKEEFDDELETFGNWTTTFEGWSETLSTYLANMSSAAVGAIAGQNIAPADVAAIGSITAPSIIENMSGYSFEQTASTAEFTINTVFAGIVKNGNKLTYVIFASVKRLGTVTGNNISLGKFVIPLTVWNKLYPYTISGIPNVLMNRLENLASGYTSYINVPSLVFKAPGSKIGSNLYDVNTQLVQDTEYIIRQEVTFTLNDNLAA